MNNGLEIAIVGMAGRFPGAKNVAEFWQNLQHGVESISSYSQTELTQLGADNKNPDFVNAGGKLDDIERFAADFFGFNPREAELLDPQHRLFLESAWTALEDAGYDGEQYRGIVGVFGGAGMNGYMFNLYRNQDVRETTSKYQLFLASEKDFLTTRVSYKLNLEGPSVNVQTACSTSLVAVHLACQSLLSGECDMALAGGVAISLTPGYIYQEGGIYSPDGHCRAFDGLAGGTVGGSGVGVVVLKRLEDALGDRDNILAVIRGSATNNDGELKVSYTAPRIDTQARVIQAAQLVAEVEPDTISYIETHGTGTQLGDPIEIAALTQAFRAGTDRQQFCAIASVKPNIGHLDAAAGVASLIKTVLCLQHKQIPPSINCDHPNPQISWEHSPFYVNRELRDWQSNGKPRRAGVSSFGIGGTNVHVIVEEPPNHGRGVACYASTENSTNTILPQLLIISAKTKTALDRSTANLATHLQKNPDLDLTDVAYTLQVGRRAFNHRRILVAETVEDAAQSLSQIDPQRVFTNTIEPGYKPVVFMFSGQGSQYVGMAWELYQHQPVFREHCDRCFQILQSYLDVSLREIIYCRGHGGVGHGGVGHGGVRHSGAMPLRDIDQTQYAQLAIFTIEYALAQLWMHWGIQPEVMIGHSIGEYVAATIAGVFTLEDALKIVATRARLMQQQPPGAMLSVALSASEIEHYINGEISLAVSNAPQMCVVSGDEAAIATLESTLQAKGIACRRLKTSHGFHSALMDGAIAPFVATVEKINLNPPQIQFISNVTGTWITDAQATSPDYWGQHMRQTVRFAEGIAEISQEPNRILLEVGAGKTLSVLARQTTDQNVILYSIRHPKDNQSDIGFILHTYGQLWLSGVKIDWAKLYPEKPFRVALPTYPFERQRYWIEAPSEEISLTSIASTLTKSDPNRWFYLPGWIKVPTPQFNSADLAQKRSSWLVFKDELGFSDRSLEHLSHNQHQVVSVMGGKDFAIHSDREVTIYAQEPEHYQQLIEHLAEQNFIPEQIIYSWNLSTNQDAALESSIDGGFYSLLNLVQALGKHLSSAIQINIVVNNLYDVVGTEKVDVNRAAIIGITKVINQEYPQINCRLIDTEIEATESNINYLLREILAAKANLPIAYRGDRRWQRIYQPYPLENSQTRLQQRGVYLIFGSLAEGLGLVFAKYLVDRFEAKLILVGDKSEGEIWHDWDLDCLGISVNLDNREEVKGAIALAESTFGKLDGVFYSTPMTNKNSASTIAEMNASHWEYNRRTKINPLHVLAACLSGKQLDFVLVQSSLSSVLGGIGLAAYASANSYLDAFVEQQNNRSDAQTPWFSVNWDACLTEEEKKNTGIGASLAEFSLTPEEVGEATAKILGMEWGSQIVVSKGDLQSRIERWLSVTSDPSNEYVKVNNIQKHSRPHLTNEYVAPKDETEKAIAEIWQQVLGIDLVGIYDSFFELGGHSLLAIQTISRIREKFEVELPMSSILADTPTVANLAAMIAQQQHQADELAIIGELLDEVQNMSPEEIQAQMEE